jgi:hypothetical protein
MVQVTFPRTELETRTAIHKVRLDKGFKTADETLIYLIERAKLTDELEKKLAECEKELSEVRKQC